MNNIVLKDPTNNKQLDSNKDYWVRFKADLEQIIREIEAEGFDDDMDIFKSWLIFLTDAKAYEARGESKEGEVDEQ